MRLSCLALMVGVLGCKNKEAERQPCPDGYEAGAPGTCFPTTDADPGDSGSPASDTGPEDTPDTGEPPPPIGIALPGNCSPPEVRPDLPLVEVGAVDSALDGGSEMKLIDIAADVERELLWGVGDGGLQPIDASSTSTPSRHAPVVSEADPSPRYQHVHVFDAEDDGHGLVYVTNWTQGLTIFDGTDPDDVIEVRTVPSIGLSDMTQWDNRLYVASHGGAVQAYDITDRTNPMPVGAIGELGTPWRLTATEGALYVADALEGTILALDRTNPDMPSIATTITLPGVQDVDAQGDLLAAAAGINGVTLYVLSDPLAPREVAQLRFGSAVSRVHLDGDHLWLVDQEGVRLVDVTSPMKAQSVGSYPTPQWAMDVTTIDDTAWVADWGAASGYARTPDVLAPDLRLQFSEVYLHPDGDMRTVTIYNTGQYILEISGAQTDIDGLEIRASSDTVGPGGTGKLYLTWDGGPATSGEVCLATNDPDSPSLVIPVHMGDTGENPLVGTIAPDFILTAIDLEGTSGGGPVPATFSQRLQDQRGQPISLLFFSEHDLASPFELIEFEHNVWRHFEPAGAKVWGISSGDPVEMAELWMMLGLTFPLFPDPDAEVQVTYPMPPALSNADYPQHWVIDADGVIIYAGNFLNPGAIRGTIADALE